MAPGLTWFAASLGRVQVQPLSIEGVWEFTPLLRADDRGVFLEAFKQSTFLETVGHEFSLQQMNISVSKAGTVRGIHFADVPPGQAKYVQCLAGRILDVVIDIRVGSPTFGQFEEIELNENSASAVFIEEGLAHAFVALENQTVVTYFVTEKYNPEREKGINPFDKTLNVKWPDVELILSEKDKQAISLEEAKNQGLLPTFDECKKLIISLN